MAINFIYSVFCVTLLSILLTPQPTSCQTRMTGSTTGGSRYVRQGSAGGDQFPQWEISYYAVDYLPICGVSLEVEGDPYWSNSVECEPAMSRFNSTSSQVAVYDISGIESSKEFGAGEQLCMCYGVVHSKGTFLDICLLIGAAAEVRIRDGVAVGIQNPEQNKAKILQQCKDITIPSSTDTSSATRATSSGSTSTGKGTTTTSTGNGASQTTTPSDEKNGGGGGGGTSKGTIIGISVGVGLGVLVAAVAVHLCLRRRWKKKAAMVAPAAPPMNQIQEQQLSKPPVMQGPPPGAVYYTQQGHWPAPSQSPPPLNYAQPPNPQQQTGPELPGTVPPPRYEMQ